MRGALRKELALELDGLLAVGWRDFGGARHERTRYRLVTGQWIRPQDEIDASDSRYAT